MMMNRPQLSDYTNFKNFAWINDYLADLEKYCDKLEGAVDKACKFYHDFYVSDSELTTEQWKEFLLDANSDV